MTDQLIFDNSAKSKQQRKNSFKKSVRETGHLHIFKNETGPYLLRYRQINSKWVKDSKSELIKIQK